MSIEDLFLDAEKVIDDYIWAELKRGMKEYGGCGCHGCYLTGKKVWEEYFPDISAVLSYENIPPQLFDRETRHRFYDDFYKTDNKE